MPKMQKSVLGQREEEKEEWADIAGWEGIYQVSSHGRLKSFKRVRHGRILSNTNKTGWYFSVVLAMPGMQRRSTRMHRLVAEAFIDNPDRKKYINHIDGNKQNNRVENLEWVTCSENVAHSMKMNPLCVLGMNLYNQIIKPNPVKQLSLSGDLIRVFRNCVEAGKATGVCTRNIHYVAARTEYKPGLTRKQAGGYRWEYCGVIDID